MLKGSFVVGLWKIGIGWERYFDIAGSSWEMATGWHETVPDYLSFKISKLVRDCGYKGWQGDWLLECQDTSTCVYGIPFV